MFSRDSEDLTDRSGFNGTKAHWNKRRRRKRGDWQNPIKIEEDEEGEKASKEDDKRKGKDNDKCEDKNCHCISCYCGGGDGQED